MTIKFKIPGIVLGSLTALVSILLSVSGIASAATFNVTGTVTGPTNGALSGVYVYASQPSSNTVLYGPVTTNTSGAYTLPVGAAGTYDIHFNPSASSGLNQSLVSQLVVSSSIVQNKQLSALTHVFSGSLKDSANNVLPSVTLRLYGNGTNYETTTNSSGNFSLTVPAAKYLVYLSGSMPGITSFTLSQSNSTSINLLTMDQQLNLTIPIATLTATARNSAGQLAYGSNENVYARATTGTTSLYPGDPGTSISLVFSQGFSTTSSATGTLKTIVGATYAASGIESSSYTTSICRTLSSTFLYDCLLVPYTVVGDASLDVPQTANATRSFSGKLTDSSSNPIANTTIKLSRHADNITTTTDANGDFSMAVGPGKYSLTVSTNTSVLGMQFTLTQANGNPTLDTNVSSISQNLNINNTYITATAYDSIGNPNYFTTVNAKSTSGTVYLYQGDPGESVVITSDSFTGTPTGTLGTIVGAAYTALGKNSTQWVGSICENIPAQKFDCITSPLTISGPVSISIPQAP